MRRHGFLVLAGLLALGAPRAADAESAAKGDSDRLGRLILKLGSDEFAEREGAAQELDAIGGPALPALKAAARADDAEVSRRASDLARRIEKRLDNARILAPHRVRLVYRDTPVTEAVADLARQTRLPVQLQPGHHPGLSGRKVTLDTGEVTAWEAFDRFCREAGLVESSLVPMKPTPIPSNITDPKQRQLLEIRMLQQRNALAYRNRQTTGLSLVDGKPPALPTCYAGAVRVRALPADLWGTIANNEGETTVLLEAAPEAKLQWQSVIGVHIDRAVDDEGQALARAESSAGMTAYGAQMQVMAGGMVISEVSPYAAGLGSPGLVPVRLKLPKKPGRAIKELHGNLAAQVQTGPERLLAVEDVLKAGGHEFKGRDGIALKVIEAGRANGQVKLRLQLTTSNPMMAWAGRAAVRRMRVVAGAGVWETVQSSGGETFQLQDAKGRTLTPVGQQFSLTAVGFAQTQEVTLTYQEGQAPPATLVLNGPRTVLVNVPFPLRDVPLSAKR